VSIIKSVPNLISYLHKFSWNFSQFLAIYFELFSSEVIFNTENTDKWGPPVSAPSPCGCHMPALLARLKGAVGTPHRHPNSPPDRAPLSAPSPRLARAVPTAHSPGPKPPPCCPKPPHCCSSTALTPSLPAAPRQVSRATGRRCRLRAAANSPFVSPSQDRCRPPEPSPRRRTPSSIQFFSPSPSTRSSGELSPPPPCPVGSLSAVGARAPPFAPLLPL
jgi:hypothetical protein